MAAGLAAGVTEVEVDDDGGVGGGITTLAVCWCGGCHYTRQVPGICKRLTNRNMNKGIGFQHHKII